jgi:nitrogenase molybdenum-iron protein beta chain
MSKSGLIEQERFTCAIGALQSVVAIPRAVPILHAGPGCGDMISGFFERSTGYAGGNTSPCTNFSENEVVFGGINRLRQIISNTYKILDTDLQVVLTGCTSGIVGDDVDSLVEEFREQGKPIVSVETAGFKCNNYEAHSLVTNAIIEHYVDGFANETRSEANSVNLLASIPYQDPFWKGNLVEYKRLLAGIGLNANILFGPFSGGVKEWQSIPKANFNVLVSPWHSLPIAEKLKTRYGQPYYHYPHIPIGANQTEEFLKGLITFALKNPKVG